MTEQSRLHQRIGFIGLGIMGRPMCCHLHTAGAEMIIYNRSKSVVQQLEGQGMTGTSSPAQAAEMADTVVLMVSDTPAVEQVLFGENGLYKGLSPRHLLIDMGTTAPAATKLFANKVEQTGANYLDAPVSGGEPGAIAANLTIMIGGDEQSVARAQPIFQVLGKNITHVGKTGAGQVAKAANQVIVGLTIGAVAEALALAKSAGVDPAKVRQALMGGFAASRILEFHGKRMVEGDFIAGGKVVTQHKDLSQALDLAEETSIELPATKLNRSLYQQLIDDGDGDLDHNALYKLISAGS